MEKLAEVAGSLKRRLVEYYRKEGHSERGSTWRKPTSTPRGYPTRPPWMGLP
ncbi:MAG: hypothetical protein AB1816_02010 [Bacillota bacterium]